MSEAENKAQRVTIRALTKNAPSVREMLNETRKDTADISEKVGSNLDPLADEDSSVA